jgi:hypothetical protein
MTTAILASATIGNFAAAVRAALADLPPEDVEDLTDGLEADLTEKVADSGEDGLGDPLLYAAELRSAAGLPHRPAKRPFLPSGETIRTGLLSLRTRTETRLRSNRYAAGSLNFLLVLRPAWWILRGWLGFEVLRSTVFGQWRFVVLPASFFDFLLLTALVLLSVQWGRGRWLPRRWLKVAPILASVVAIVVAVPILAEVGALPAQVNYADEAYTPPGLALDGNPVSNIFAYDANGEPLTEVQLFTQNGKPLKVGGDQVSSGVLQQMDDQGNVLPFLVPNGGVTGRTGWNVFPLQQVPTDEISPASGGIKPDATPTPAPLPFARIQPLLHADPATGSDSPAPTPSPVRTPAATPAP